MELPWVSFLLITQMTRVMVAIQTTTVPIILSSVAPDLANPTLVIDDTVLLPPVESRIQNLSSDHWVCSRLQSSDVIREQIGAPTKLSSV